LVAVEVLLRRWIVRNRERLMVSEVDARRVPGASRDSCLICEGEGSIRRIWSFPADWSQLDDAALGALFEVPYRWVQPAANRDERERARIEAQAS
jgi:hypothetical protein